MAIKRIQLRGISRSPSDRMTEDGGCAESLNVYLDNDELAPVVKPTDISDKIGVTSLGVGADVLHIHKVTSEDIYVLRIPSPSGDTIGRYEANPFIFRIIHKFKPDEEIKEISSIGNTLIVATSLDLHYFVFFKGTYKYLGTQVPIPQVEFQTVLNPWKASVSMYPQKDKAIHMLNMSAWENAIEELSSGDIISADAKDLKDLNDELWESINLTNSSLSKYSRHFPGPILVRSAVRLFDGSYIYQSVPVLIGAGSSSPISVRAVAEYAYVDTGPDSDTELSATYLEANMNTYNAKAILKSWNIEGWEDIIESLDIFVSSTIYYPPTGVPFKSISNDGYEDLISFMKVEFDTDTENGRDMLENEILNKSNFYHVRGFMLSGLHAIKEGYTLYEGEAFPSQDDLLVKDRLPDYEQSFAQIIPTKLYNFNNSLLATSGQIILPTGHGFLNSTSTYENISSRPQYAMCFFVRGRDEKLHKVVGKDYNGNTLFAPYQDPKTYAFAYPYGMLFYPDARCEEVQFWDDGRIYSVEMRAHPNLNCAYAYWGLDKKITDLNIIKQNVSLEAFIADEDRMIYENDKLYQSQTNNPLYFPLTKNITFNSEVVGVASAMRALSEGQFGQYPLYVFTKEGVWSVDLTADGSLGSRRELSREECSNSKGILSFEQAVIFVTSQGVKMLSGSQIASISPNMKGRPYMLESSAENIISGQPTFCSLEGILKDSTPFLKYIQNAMVAYDYTGRRLLFANTDYPYLYVYMMDTSSWHKLFLGNYRVSRFLNSDPRVEAEVKDDKGEKYIFDMSSQIEDSHDRLTLPGAIITRPFDLGEPDVFKTITDVRIRGYYGKGAAKFILLGSNDGINFCVINTFRGKSWKMFRLIILADLLPTERISWVDVQYETRFTNRLR